MSRYKILQKAKEDYNNGVISKEEYHNILDECDYLEIIDECRDYGKEEKIEEYDEEVDE